MKGKAAAGQPAAAAYAPEADTTAPPRGPGEDAAGKPQGDPALVAFPVRVTAHVSRRRAGRAWTAGEVMIFPGGQMRFAQFMALEQDAGFLVELLVAEADLPPSGGRPA